jgi:predicted ATPase
MRITEISVQGWKSLEDTGVLELSQINVLVGPNNSGKSSLLHALRLIQIDAVASATDIRLGRHEATVEFHLTGMLEPRSFLGNASGQDGTVRLVVRPAGIGIQLSNTVGGDFSQSPKSPQSGRALANEPSNFIYTYLSRRKVTNYDRSVDRDKQNAVTGNLQNLTAKVSRLLNPSDSRSDEFTLLCERLLGFRLGTLAVEHGQIVGVRIGDVGEISIESMGEGVANMLGLIVDLCVGDGNMFLIEEPENDVHPRALRGILDVIVDKSDRNQFVVSTHSNVVLRHLGGAPNSIVYVVSQEFERGSIPTSIITRLEDEPQARVDLLRELGYELGDLELWEGWLILEESSAETILRNYLIPWFAPMLARIRTVSAGGTSKVGQMFDAFRRLFLYAHLEPQYSKRAWVVLDGDETGRAVIAKLRSDYSGVPPEHFKTFQEPSFENYYPARFAERVAEIESMSHGDKPKEKLKLLSDVRIWCDSEPEQAREEFGTSAAEVIELLQLIEATFKRAPARKA